MVQVQNTLYAKEMQEAGKEIVERMKTIHTARPDKVFDQLESLEHYLTIPYNSKEFYIGFGQELMKYVKDHDAGSQYQQVHNNITVIRSLLNKVNEGLVELVLRQKGEEITEITELTEQVLFVLAGTLAEKICKVVSVVEETTTRSGPQKGLKVAGWNDRTKEWTTLPETQYVLQTVIMGKQRLVYIASTSLRLLHLTADQQMLVNGELPSFESVASGEMNSKIQERYREMGETYDPKNRNG